MILTDSSFGRVLTLEELEDCALFCVWFGARVEVLIYRGSPAVFQTYRSYQTF